MGAGRRASALRGSFEGVRICLVAPYSWAFPVGVLEHADSLGDHLERRGHVVEVVAPNDPMDRLTRLLHRSLGRHGDLPERITPVGRSVPLPSNGTYVNVAFSPRAFLTAKRAVKRFRPDIVHVHEPLVPPVCWGAIWAAKELGVPAVGTFHSHYPDGCYHYATFKRVLSPFYGALDAKIAVSPMAAKTVADHFAGEIHTIPNGVDVDRFGYTHILRSPNEVLFLGRPATRKGLSVLLNALPVVLRELPETRLVIAGSHPEDVKLPKKLLSSVEVRGMLDDDELVHAMHTASVLCAPSVGGESFGIVLIEAMAAGLPVLASDIPGYDAVVTYERDGVLVPPADASALAEALVGLLRDPKYRERLSEAGLNTARRYDWPLITAEIEEVYLTLNGRRMVGGENTTTEA
jgi:phosphatidylinositol alpha-mannosyltransferase